METPARSLATFRVSALASIATANMIGMPVLPNDVTLLIVNSAGMRQEQEHRGHRGFAPRRSSVTPRTVPPIEPSSAPGRSIQSPMSSRTLYDVHCPQ